MQSEYVDVFDEKYTKFWKKVAWIRFGLKWSINIIMCISLIVLYYAMEPYMMGDMELEELPLTLSQLECVLGFLAICWMFKGAMKLC